MRTRSRTLRYPKLAEPVLADPILFGDFANLLELGGGVGGGLGSATEAAVEQHHQQQQQEQEQARRYCDLGGFADVQPLLEGLLAEYNTKHAKSMQLVFFEDALEHLTRMIRTLTTPLVSCMACECACASCVCASFLHCC